MIAKPTRRVAPEDVARRAGRLHGGERRQRARDSPVPATVRFRGKGFDTFCPARRDVVPLETLEPVLAVASSWNGRS